MRVTNTLWAYYSEQDVVCSNSKHKITVTHAYRLQFEEITVHKSEFQNGHLSPQNITYSWREEKLWFKSAWNAMQ